MILPSFSGIEKMEGERASEGVVMKARIQNVLVDDLGDVSNDVKKGAEIPLTPFYFPGAGEGRRPNNYEKALQGDEATVPWCSYVFSIPWSVPKCPRILLCM